MRDTCTAENRRDFSARYVDTFGWLITGDTKTLVHINEVGDGNVYFDKGTQLIYNARIGSGVEFEFIPVDMGYFRSITNEVYLLSRVPARQWKRGISGSNTSVYNISTGMHEHVTYDLLASLFAEGHKPYSDKWVSGVACAMSKHFAISPRNLLRFYNEEIGTVSKDGVITLSNSMVATEINDVIRRNNLNLKVA